MASELTLTISAALVNGTLVDSFTPATLAIDQSTSVISNQVRTIGTSAETVDFGDVASEGYLFVQNHDATNFVTMGPDSTGQVTLIKLKPGEVAAMRLLPGVVLKATADTAICNVQFMLLAD